MEKAYKRDSAQLSGAFGARRGQKVLLYRDESINFAATLTSNSFIMANINMPGAPLSFENAVRRVLSNYAGFSGRASRAEFWWFMLFTFIVSAVFGVLAVVTGLKFFAWIQNIIGLALLIPSLAVGARRLHDTGRAAGWLFINLIPAVGFIIYVVFCAQPSQVGPNRFGEQPAN